METYVLDASVAVKWYVVEQDRERAREWLVSSETQFTAPDLLFPEVANVLWRKVRLGSIDRWQMKAAIADLAEQVGSGVPSATLLPDAIDLAARIGHSIYDCVYLALARRDGTRLLTADERFIAKLAGPESADIVDLRLASP